MRLVSPGTAADTTGDGAWVPVTVTAVLAEPVVNLDGHPFHLDGPAAKAAFWSWTATRGHCSLPPPDGERCADFALPMATWAVPAPPGSHPLALGAGGLAWGWACSRALYEPEGHATVNVRKKPETDAAARYARDRTWDIGHGPLKARDEPMGTVLAREIRWHALADAPALRLLLERMHGIGRKAAHGHGRVLRWTVEEDGDREGWRDRVLPQRGGMPGSIRAPYWHPSRRMPCTP